MDGWGLLVDMELLKGFYKNHIGWIQATALNSLLDQYNLWPVGSFDGVEMSSSLQMKARKQTSSKQDVLQKANLHDLGFYLTSFWTVQPALWLVLD